MKNFLFMSGGIGLIEMNAFAYARFAFDSLVMPPPLCAETSSVIKVDPITGAQTESAEIKSKINSGAGWVNFLGHGSPTVFDMDGWEVDRLNNFGKYGILTTLSCNSGAFAEPREIALNKAYVLAPDKGFISAGGSTATGDVTSDEILLGNMLLSISDTNLNLRRFGDIFVYGKSNMYPFGFEIFTMMQFSYLGDPLTELRIGTKPDLYFIPQDIKIQSNSNETLITDADSIVIISGLIHNAGICEYDTVEVFLKRIYNGRENDTILYIPGICKDAPFEVKFPVKDMPGIHTISLEIDPDFKIILANRNYTTYNKALEVFSQGLSPLEPLAFWDMRPRGPIFRVINPLAGKDNFKYYFEIRDTKDTSTVPLITSESDTSTINIDESYIEWSPFGKLTDDTPYWFTARTVRQSNLQTSTLLQLPFFAKSYRESNKTYWIQSGANNFNEDLMQNLVIDTLNDTVGIHIIDKFISYKVIGATGFTQYPREVYISINNKVYIDSTDPSQAPVGMNLVVFSSDSGKIVYKRFYDTWDEGPDSSGVQFNRFMRDTVHDDDYVFLSSCGESFRYFFDVRKDCDGSYDTLKAVLHSFGSGLVDSIHQFHTTFLMVGKRGAKPGTIHEALDTNGGLLQDTSNLPIQSRTGNLTTPVIGPAKSWENVIVQGYFPASLSSGTISVIGLPRVGSQEKLLLQSVNSSSFSLAQISPYDYPYIKLNMYLERKNDSVSPYISSVTVQFVATPEFTISQSQTKILNDSVMRDEISNMQFVVRNISPRIASDSTILNMGVYSNSTLDTNATFIVPPLNPDGTITFRQALNTKNLSLTNNIDLTVNPTAYPNEIYSFNNSDQLFLHIYEDTTKPVTYLYIDSVLVINGEYVEQTPDILVVMTDNSLLPVNENSISVFINGVFYGATTPTCTFQNFGEVKPKKATLAFKSQPLEFGQNLITIIAIDASGNKDTTSDTVYVSQGGYVENLINNPNPFETGTYFSFNYKSPELNAIAYIDIYDLRGQKIISLTRNVTLGTNDLYWNGQDFTGNLVSPGIYFYRMNVIGTTWVEPVFGKCMMK
jgi:hypothetical protein